MLLCPIKGQSRVSQGFGKNPEMYKQFGMKGHNGIDRAVPVGTPVYAPMDGIAKVTNSKDEGYGLHVKLRNAFKSLEVTEAHLSEVVVTNGQKVMTGDIIGYSGNSGYSTGAHLHESVRRLVESSKDVWSWTVKDRTNGYSGAFDHSEFIINWQ